jgi:hypothetical protein
MTVIPFPKPKRTSDVNVIAALDYYMRADTMFAECVRNELIMKYLGYGFSTPFIDQAIASWPLPCGVNTKRKISTNPQTE